MARFGPYDTQWLTQARFEPTAARRRAFAAGVLTIALLMVLGYSVAGRGSEQAALAARLDEAERTAASLDAELERTRAELALERATRQELQRQADSLGARVAELSQQMEFLASRRTVARND